LPNPRPTRSPREFSKKTIVLDLLKCAGGATFQEHMSTMQWQAISACRFISGSLGMKIGINIDSFKSESG